MFWLLPPALRHLPPLFRPLFCVLRLLLPKPERSACFCARKQKVPRRKARNFLLCYYIISFRRFFFTVRYTVINAEPPKQRIRNSGPTHILAFSL